jgi:ABC-type polar amino acid transport system, ATPase component
MGFAREVADRLVFMEAGEIVEVGTTEQFFSAPREERTKKFCRKYSDGRGGCMVCHDEGVRRDAK